MTSANYPTALNPTFQKAMQEKRAVVNIADQDENYWPVVVYYFTNGIEAEISTIQALDKNYADLRYDVIEEIKSLEEIKTVTIL